MVYFAYGSNMCTGRLRQRVPSARPISSGRLTNHSLRFHKRSDDGSGKCDAHFTGEPEHVVWGVLFEIDPREKHELDRAEGLGKGYRETWVTVIDQDANHRTAFSYVVEKNHIDTTLQPYSWYTRFVIEGARQHNLPTDYVNAIAASPTVEDPDRLRDTENREIPC